MKLVIRHKKKRLPREKALGVLRLLTRKHAHTLGQQRPRECSGKCQHEKGNYMGHGVCLLYRFVEPNNDCRKCKSLELIRQLNFIFQECAPFKGRSLVANWE